MKPDEFAKENRKAMEDMGFRDRPIGEGENYGVESFGEQARIRHGSPTFYNLLKEMAETHDRKSHDYASDNNPAGNYHFAGQLALLFAHSPQDAGFVGRFAEKLYRIKNLESSGKIGISESLENTEKDMAVIILFWIADRRDRRSRSALESEKKQYYANEARKKQEEKLAEELITVIGALSDVTLLQMEQYIHRLLADKKAESIRGLAQQKL